MLMPIRGTHEDRNRCRNERPSLPTWLSWDGSEVGTMLRVSTGDPWVPHAWAIDLHWQHPGRTPTGELVYRAKPYGDKGSDPSAVAGLIDVMSEAMRFEPTGFRTAEALLAVPPWPGKSGIDLPTLLAEGLSRAWQIPAAVGLVVKSRDTQMKSLPSTAKAEAIAGAFSIGASPGVVPERVIIVDDLIFSGRTLLEVAKVLRGAGVQRVMALAATRVKKGMA